MTSPSPGAPARGRDRLRDTLVLAFGLVECDRLLGALVRLTRHPLPDYPDPRFGVGAWMTAFDVTSVVIALAAFAYVHAYVRRVQRTRALGTVVSTAAAHHTVLILAALAMGEGLGADPVITTAYVATSAPILVLAVLNWRDALRGDAHAAPPA